MRWIDNGREIEGTVEEYKALYITVTQQNDVSAEPVKTIKRNVTTHSGRYVTVTDEEGKCTEYKTILSAAKVIGISATTLSHRLIENGGCYKYFGNTVRWNNQLKLGL